MNWPFVSRKHHEAVTALSARLISDRDERIRALEAERRLLWDKLCMFGFGQAVFEVLSPAADVPAEEKKQPVKPGAGMFSRRPSDIMREMDTRAQNRYERKQHPSRDNSPIAEMLQRADMKVGE